MRLEQELQEDVFAPNDVPSYDLALRDGWAVNASEAGHRKVLDDVVENGRTPPDLPPMSAIWVNTGGPIPKRGNRCHYSFREQIRFGGCTKSSGTGKTASCGEVLNGVWGPASQERRAHQGGEIWRFF